jgi:hypothetical protein
VDEGGTTVGVFVGNQDGSLTITAPDTSSPTGWTAITTGESVGTSLRAAAAPPSNPVPPLYAIVGGAGGTAAGGTIRIGGPATGGVSIRWTSDPNNGFTVSILYYSANPKIKPVSLVFYTDGKVEYFPGDGGLPVVWVPGRP